MNKEQKNGKIKKSSNIFKIIRKVILKSFLTLLAVIVIISLSFIFLSQTKMFRSWFYGKVLELVNENIEGRIEASDIKILPFQGIKISDLKIIAANDTVVNIKKLALRYSFSPIFNNYLYIKSLTVTNPTVKLIRNPVDSTWNFEHIVLSTNDSSKGSKLNWVFDVQNLTVINGKLKIDDKVQQTNNYNNHFYISHADFRNINISMLAKANIPKQKYYLEINKFLFTERNSNIDVRELKLNANLDSNGIKLNNVKLRSNHTAIRFNAVLNNLNPFKAIDSTALYNANFTMTFNADFLNLILANKLFENIPEIDDDIKLYGHITGNANKLKLEQFKIKKNKSEIFFSGFYANALSNNPNYKIRITKSNLYDKDFQSVKNAFGYSEIYIAHSYIERIEAFGNSKQISAYLNFRSPYANLNGNAKLNLLNITEYNTYLKFEKVNLGLLLSDKSMESNLNGNINLKGKGKEANYLDFNLDLALNKSTFADYRIDSLKLNTRVDSNMKVKLNNFLLVLDNYYSDSLIHKYSAKSKLKTTGSLDLSDMTKPKYDIDVDINEFNLASLFKSYLLPQYIDTKIHVNGSGIHPDSLETDLTAKVDNCMFGNRALMPFNLDIHIERFFDSGRQILINSELFDLELNGEYNISDFTYFADVQIGELVGFIDRKIRTFSHNSPLETDTLKIKLNRRKIPAFKNFTFDLTATLHDLTPIGIAVGQPYLSGNADIDLYIDAVDDKTIIDLRKLSVNNFQYKDGQVAIVVNPTYISTFLDMTLEDSLSVINRIDLDLNGKTDSYIDNMQFSKPKLNVRYKNDSIKIALSSLFNKSIVLQTNGNFIMNPGVFSLTLDSTKVAIENLFAWHSLNPVNITLSNEGLEFKNFVFTRSTNEMIKLSGLVNSSVAKNINLEIKNFPLNELSSLTYGEQKKFLQKLQGKIKSLNLNLEDSLNSPKIRCDFITDYILSDRREIGLLKGKANYQNKLLTGELLLSDSTGKEQKLSADIVSLPIDLALKIGGKRILPGRPIDIKINANNLNVNIVNPFIPNEIKNLDGFADIDFSIEGVKDSVDYLGFIDAKNVRFLSTPNNLYYNAHGKINIENDNISFDNFIIINDPADLKGSKTLVSGSLIFSNFEIKQFDFNIKTKGLKLLSMASAKTMPDLYGDFEIRTRNEGINFTGDFEHPYLKGDIEVLKSRLYMPSTQSKNQIPAAYFKYKIKDNNLIVEDIPDDSLLTKLFGNVNKDTNNVDKEEKYTEQKQTKSFADLMKYDLNIWFYMPLQITMDMGAQLGQITAIVATKSPSSPIHYYVDPAKNTATIIGSLEVKKNSVFNYFKLFNITGDIEFPTGNIDNPRLNLKAIYEGKTTINENIRNYKVILYITGTKNKPLITFDYTIDNEPARGDKAKIREDALFLLMFGLTKSEFESPSSSGGSDFSNIGAQGIASALSRSVTEMLSGTGFITSADIDLQGGSFQNAKLKLSGQLLGMTWKVGGTISDIMNGYEFTAEVPIGLLLFPNKFRSLFLSFMTTYNPSQNISRNQKNWEIKLKFGNEF